MSEKLQKALDRFHDFRKDAVIVLAYLTLRVFGKEPTYDEIKAGTYADRESAELNLGEAKDIDLILDTSKAILLDSEKRLAAVTDKCQTLLTFGSLLLGVVGLLLPKYLEFDSWWMRWLSFVAIAMLFDGIIILSMFFDVGKGMSVSLTKDDVPSDSHALKRSLANSYLRCSGASERRTDYLVDLYSAARFCFLSALSGVAVLVFASLTLRIPSDQTTHIIQEIRADSTLTNLLRGPKGDPGAVGSIGPKGENGSSVSATEIVNCLLSDVRFRETIEKAKCENVKKAQ